MTTWTAAAVAEALGTSAPNEGRFTGVSTDTRTLGRGELYVALEGARYDGHAFLDDARHRGAAGAVVRRGTPDVPDLTLFVVDDTLRALGRLAHHRRRQIAGPVVAVTGTNGKTSTKEFIAAVLGTSWQVHATRANLNNEIGVPLTILGAPQSTDALVVEAGASELGEIGRLREVIAPTIGVITNVTRGHVEGFGSERGVLDEKVSLLQGVPVAIVGTTPPELVTRARASSQRVVTAGLEPNADVHPDAWHLDPDGRCVLEVAGARATIPAIGRHQGDNAMLALATGRVLDVDVARAAGALEGVRLPAGRCDLLRAGERVVLDDTYNANPASVEAALATVESLRGHRPLVVVVGTMLELGSASQAEHDRVADLILAADPMLIGAVGAFVPALERHRSALGDRLIVADDADDLGRAVAGRLRGNEFILLKASRGMRLERAIPHLLPDREAPCSTTS